MSDSYELGRDAARQMLADARGDVKYSESTMRANEFNEIPTPGYGTCENSGDIYRFFQGVIDGSREILREYGSEDKELLDLHERIERLRDPFTE